MSASWSSWRSSSLPKYGMKGLILTTRTWVAPLLVCTVIRRWPFARAVRIPCVGRVVVGPDGGTCHDRAVAGEESRPLCPHQRAHVGQEVFGHVAGVAGGHELADGPAEGDVLLATQEDTDERGEHERHQEQDARHHRERLRDQVDGGALEPDRGHDHLHLESGHRERQEVHARGGNRRLAAAGQEQGHDDVAAEEPERRQERDPVGQEVRRCREARCRQVLQGEREGDNADRENDGQGCGRGGWVRGTSPRNGTGSRASPGAERCSALAAF